MSSLFGSLPVYLLSSVVLLGGFSRFTHGKYTPQWYTFQEYHAPDDGSTVALITPIVDIMLGLMLLFGNKTVKLSAAVTSLVFFTIGLAMQIQESKQYGGDVALIALGAVAVTRLFRQ
ncbi:hypothetical protein FQN54_007031 [Arachnomyces sp. PD_36]|nr:hypothetical protein FQN54_007031 [Arachnomyces sp. PD_36]